METPLIAVFMVTYNHELYIGQAIESVLSQNTIFRFHLFIGEDASSDQTGVLCQQYADRFPQQITLYRRPKNIGIFENANQLFQACLASGAKYIALLEGDDCWLGKEKLQRQVSYLEENPECAATYHNTDFLLATGERKPMFKSLLEKMILSDVISKFAPFHTTSFVFRAEHFCRPSWFQDIYSVDLAMYMWHAQFGYFKGFKETWSLYRIHGEGLTAGQDHQMSFHQKRWLLHSMMSGKLSPPYHEKSQDLIQFHYNESVHESTLKVNHVLFFDSTSDIETKKLKMLLRAAILPFYLSKGKCFAFFDAFNLVRWKRFNNWKLRFLYRKQWKSIRAIVFLTHDDLRQFQSFFLELPISYWVVNSVPRSEMGVSWNSLSSVPIEAKERLIQGVNDMNELLHQWKKEN